MALATGDEKQTGSKRLFRLLGFISLFLASFVVFVYLTFPYEVLKESLAADLSQSTGYAVRVDDLSPALPLGLKAENIKVAAPGGATLSLSSVVVRLAVHQLFLGRVSPSILLKSGKGIMELDANFKVFDLVQGMFIPRKLFFEAKDFPLDDIIAFGISLGTSGPDANPMLAPLLEVISVSATMQAKSQFDLDLKNPTLSTGFADITLKKAVLRLDHPTLGLPNQEFTRAGIKAKVEGGSVVIDKSSGLVAEELEILMNGKVNLKPDPMASQLDLNMSVALNKGLREKFGFVMDAMTGSASSEGKITMQVRGPLNQPAVTTF